VPIFIERRAYPWASFLYAAGVWLGYYLGIKSIMDGQDNINPTTMVLLTAVAKIILCVVLFVFFNKNTPPEIDSASKRFQHLVAMLLSNKGLMKLYAIPAFLYVLYDNLTFVNLATFDAGTYGNLYLTCLGNISSKYLCFSDVDAATPCHDCNHPSSCAAFCPPDSLPLSGYFIAGDNGQAQIKARMDCPHLYHGWLHGGLRLQNQVSGIGQLMFCVWLLL